MTVTSSHPSPRRCSHSTLFRSLFILGIVSSGIFCEPMLLRAQRKGGELPGPELLDPKFRTDTVATVGPIVISGEQFLLTYEFGPAFTKRQKDSRRKYLEFMINEKLLALDAAARSARSTPSVERSVAEIGGDLATEELYREDVLNKVHVSHEEIRDGMAAQRTHYSLRWLYAKTKPEIDVLHRTLLSGAAFDSVFTKNLGDGVNSDLRSWETTRFQVKLRQPSLWVVVDTLRPRIPSAVIEGPDGWYILYIADVSIDAIATTADDMKARHDVEQGLTKLKADSLSDAYIDVMMQEKAPVIDRRTFGLLSAFLAQEWAPKEQRERWMFDRDLDHEMLASAITNIDQHGKDRLVKLNDRSVTLGRFLSWYRARSTVIKFRTTSLHAFEASLQDAVWKMVRDGLLIERAQHRNLLTRETVREQKRWWEEKILYAYAKKQIEDSIQTDDPTLRKYYADHERDFRDSLGHPMPFGDVRDKVRTQCRSLELTKRLLHRLISLKRTYPVAIHDDVLRSLPVANENDPKAIDVYIAKTGGTFPHPAFPAIDYDWQTWQ